MACDRLDRVVDILDVLLPSSTQCSPLGNAPLVSSLASQLRPHQQVGINWLYSRMGGANPGAILADDMGLGKTLEVLAWISSIHITRPLLIVAPPSLIGNWQREAERWTPHLKVREWCELGAQPVAAHIILMTYDAMVRHVQTLSNMDFAFIIFDEAQALKSEATKRNKAAHQLPGPKLAMTGTPIENSLLDLYALLALVQPDMFESRQQFEQMLMHKGPEGLWQMVQPWVLHRRKTDIEGLGLPDKVDKTVYCVLSETQRRLYAHAISRLPSSPQGALALIQHLKQLCNDPRLVAAQGASGKLSWLRTQLDAWQSPALVFSQYRGMIDILEQVGALHGWQVHRIDGTMSRKKREAALSAWRESDVDKRLFVLSLRAAGTGLTLTEASNVVHYDRWWNPAVEDQATDRSFRIGQTRDVHVHKLVTHGTLEERIDAVLASKKGLQRFMNQHGQAGLEKLVQLA